MQASESDLPLPTNPSPDFLDWLTLNARLTPRERDLVRLTAGLLDHQEMATALGLTLATVRRRQASLLTKLHLGDGHRGLLRWIVEQHDRWRAHT